LTVAVLVIVFILTLSAFFLLVGLTGLTLSALTLLALSALLSALVALLILFIHIVCHESSSKEGAESTTSSEFIVLKISCRNILQRLGSSSELCAGILHCIFLPKSLPLTG
jgi:hypothetical protein